jgi:hypothetical protein
MGHNVIVVLGLEGSDRLSGSCRLARMRFGSTSTMHNLRPHV